MAQTAVSYEIGIGTDGYFEQKPGKPSDIGMLKYTIKTNIRDKSTAATSLEKIYI